MANRGYDDCDGRFDQDGPTSTGRERPKDPTGEPFARTPETTLRAETRGGQYRRRGWDKYEMPTTNDGPADADDLQQFYARGGNAGAGYNPAAYPGGSAD
jgi:hypothetical protein